MNSVNIIGRLVRDPEQVATQSGTEMTTFSIAVDEGKEDVSYFDCKSFGKTAELVARYKKKGDQVGVSGHLKQERWEKDGQKRSTVRIIADRVTFVGSRQDAAPDGIDQAKQFVKDNRKDPDDVPFGEDHDIPW
jgi:single-strand DNA-binding protein